MREDQNWRGHSWVSFVCFSSTHTLPLNFPQSIHYSGHLPSWGTALLLFLSLTATQAHKMSCQYLGVRLDAAKTELLFALSNITRFWGMSLCMLYPICQIRFGLASTTCEERFFSLSLCVPLSLTFGMYRDLGYIRCPIRSVRFWGYREETPKGKILPS